MTYWMLVTSRENFEISRKMGFAMAGMKPKWRRAAEQVMRGDKLVYYVKGEGVFAGVLDVTSKYWEAESGDDPWKAKDGAEWNDPKRRLNYPFRFKTNPVVILAEEKGVIAKSLEGKLEFPSKAPSWGLAFQGNVHELSGQDFGMIERAVEQERA